MTSKAPLYLEDLEVGQRFVSGTHLVEAAEIKAFAQQFDPQPFHLDEQAAEKTFFGGLAASGWHTAAISMRLFVEAVPIAGGNIGAGGEITWPKPTRAGSILHLESEIVAVRPSQSRPDRGMVTIRNETVTQSGEVVQVLVAKMVVLRRSSAAPSA